MCGCVFVRDNQILTSGYAGAPPGFPHCDDVGHELECRFKVEPESDMARGETFTKAALEQNYSVHCIRTIHAEQNAILQAAKRGISLDGSTLYVNMTPCRTCAMFLVGVGVKRVVCKQKYHSSVEAEDIFSKSHIKLEFMSDEILKF
jgi:dCMP deaminase